MPVYVLYAVFIYPHTKDEVSANVLNRKTGGEADYTSTLAIRSKHYPPGRNPCIPFIELRPKPT